MDNIGESNPFFRSVKQALKNNEIMSISRLVISDEKPTDAPNRTYNRPTGSEISAIVTGDGHSTDSPFERNVIQNIGGGICRTPAMHTSYDPFAYVITHAWR